MPGVSLLVVLLAVTFGVEALLVFEAWATAAEQRATGERALRDAATYATWSAARIEEASLHLALSTVFQRVSGRAGSGEPPLPPLDVVQQGADYAVGCRCAPTVPVRAYFRLDLRDGSVVTSVGEPLGAPSPAAIRWLGDTIRVAVGRFLFPYAIAFRGRGAEADVIAYTLRSNQRGEVVGAYGLVTRADSLAATMLPRLLEARKGIIPSALRGESPNDSIVFLTLHGPSGVPLSTSADEARLAGDSARLVSDTTALAAWAGGMFVRVALRPEAARLLRREVNTPYRLPIWFGLLALTGGLIAVIAHQLRREHELARVRSEFTTSVSHELRTPLAQIMLFGETLTLGRARSRHERTAAAEVIVREARRLMRMVENALHFARAERHAVELVRERVALAPLVREVLESFAPLAWAAGVSVRDELDDRVVGVVDRAALRQILLNLLDNAIKYGPRAQRVAVRLVACAGPHGGVARVSVEDEGPGVQPRDRERIWLPFVRVPLARRGPGGETTGSGIGLAVVRDLARRHGGAAWVEDRDGTAGAHGPTGARFVVELPLADDTTSPLDHEAAVGARRNGQPAGRLPNGDVE
jgi:signal transduction histidine kinase